MIEAELSEAARNELLELLDKFEFSILVLDTDVMALVSALCPFSLLQTHGVQLVSPLTESSRFESKSVVLARPSPSALSKIVKSCASASNSVLPVLMLIPGKTLYAEQILADNGLLGDIELLDWNVGFIQTAIDGLMSLVLPHAGLENFEDETAWAVATTLADLQRKYGPIGRLSGFGETTKRIKDIVQSLSRKPWSDNFDRQYGQVYSGAVIDQVVLLDRTQDWVGMLRTQSSYAGAIDEYMGLSAGGVVGKSTTVRDDTLFKELWSLGFADACEHIHRAAKQVQAGYRSEHSTESDSSVGEMRALVSRLGTLQNAQRRVDTNTRLAGEVMAELEHDRRAFELQSNLSQLGTSQAVASICDIAYRGASLSTVLRLSCLLCLMKGGIKEKNLHQLYDEILKCYGPWNLAILTALENHKILGTSLPSYSTVERQLKLENGVPVLARLAQVALGQFKADLSSYDYFDEVQLGEDPKEAKLRRILFRNTPGYERPLVIVFFVGGCTLTEAAAVRNIVSGHQKRPLDIVIATSGVITGEDITFVE